MESHVLAKMQFSTLSVESIKIGKDVQTIKRKAFGFVWGEETTIIPANVKTIEQNAFATIKNIEFREILMVLKMESLKAIRTILTV